MKILICGDSFASDWTDENEGLVGWLNLIGKQHDVTILATSAVGEYKILKQIQSANLSIYDAVIISHAPISKMHCVIHPFYTGMKSNGDLMPEDLRNSAHPDAMLALNFINRFVDDIYQYDIANMCVDKIISILANYPNLIQIHLEHYRTESKYKQLVTHNISPILELHPGLMNHFSDEGNKIVVELIDKLLSSAAQSNPL